MIDNEIFQYDPLSLANFLFDEKIWDEYNKWLIKRYGVFMLSLSKKEIELFLRWSIEWEAYEISCYARDYLMVIEENKHLLTEE